MKLKEFLIFLIIFSHKNAVGSNDQEALFEITDIKSFKNYLMKNYNTSYDDYLMFKNVTMDEKNKITGDLILETIKLINKLSGIKSTDEDHEQFLWEIVLKKINPTTVNIFELHDYHSRLKFFYETIEFYIQQIRSSKWKSSFANHTYTCLHPWAIYHYSINIGAFKDSLSYRYVRSINTYSFRQVYLDLVRLLPNGELREEKCNSYGNCEWGTSFHQGLYNAYRKLIVKSFENFSINYLAMVGQAVCSNDPISYRNDVLVQETDLMDSLKLIMEMTKAKLHNTTHYTYLCNPVYNEDNEFGNNDKVELERMVQTIIIAEKDLSTTQSCSHNCNLDSIKDTINRTECSEFRDCYYNTDSYSITELNNNSRRYSYFVGYNSGSNEHPYRYGDSDRRFYDDTRRSKLSSRYDWGSMRYCDYCICTCVRKSSRSPHIVTAISFRNQVSNVNDNMVVIGFKFVKKDYMIHIQILEGQVLPHGKIGNESWKSLEKFDYNETTEKYYVLNDNNDSIIPLELGVDYGHPDIMNLNDVMAPEKHVITGVRFRFAGDSLDSPKRKQGPIELQIRVTPFDFVKGKLINIYQSSWISPKEQVLKDELVLENPDNPIYAPPKVHPIITSNKFVKFRASDLKKDAGQSTVPFFDSREINFFKRSVLGGVGLIHRGHVGFGGFLGIKIFDFDMSPYFDFTDGLNSDGHNL